MRCDECQEKLGLYWELPDQDTDKVDIDLHLLDCPACAEQFRLWEESDWMIRSFSEVEEADLEDRSFQLNQSVMDRIYADDDYLRPVHDRTYRFTTSFRFRSALLIAGCMAIFISGLIYAVLGDWGTAVQNAEPMTGLLETANAGSDGIILGGEFYAEVPVASISDPFVLKVVPTVPQYWIVFSLFGVIATLLLSNWFARTRR
ncbi:anti-sigma factor family protein [Paenibacillus kobensis]|uniref:anti-sigma factor family protein n=1 Tax=Paenibacillus kobensis TaxID=59841 RepID=UPI000FDCBE44|nr:zf-HC2 domain-containing protein [Paenibacillus kobensis]